MGAITGSGQRYALGLGQLWPDVSRALARLETIAGDPLAYEPEDVADQLAHLQYRLHVAGESVIGLEPPLGAETAHAELVDALTCARDATSEIAEAVADEGRDAFRLLLHEWRGALFRVRLARLRLQPTAVRRAAPESREPANIGRVLLALALTLAGAIAFVGGATIGTWPLWAAGMVAVVGGMLAYRP